MKILGRILIILAAFAFVMGITYVVMNSTSSATTAPAFERGAQGPPQSGDEQPQFANSERPEFRGAGPRGGGWMFAVFKNIGVMAIIVALIAVPKSFMRRQTSRSGLIERE